jgi:ATP-dependent Clp protease, protease subunit
MLNQILAKNTGQTLGKVEKDVDRDYWMSADEAKKYGLVDKVIDSRKLAQAVPKSA